VKETEMVKRKAMARVKDSERLLEREFGLPEEPKEQL